MHCPVTAVQVRGSIQEGCWPHCCEREEMIIALIKCDKLAGLTDQFDLLNDRHIGHGSHRQESLDNCNEGNQ